MTAEVKLLALGALLAYAAAIGLVLLSAGGRTRRLQLFVRLALWLGMAGRLAGTAVRPCCDSRFWRGMAANAMLLVIRSGQQYQPPAVAFDVFAAGALALAAVVTLMNALRAGRATHLVLVPLAAVCLSLMAALLAAAMPALERAWFGIHVALSAAGSAALALAAGTGAVYLHVHGRLRRKDAELLSGGGPSLERVERVMRRTLVAGFVLLTAAIAMGLYDALAGMGGRYFASWWTHPKVLLSAVAWLVYFAAMMASYARRFRGRQVAYLSIAGLVLLAAVLAISTVMPKDSFTQ